MNKNCIYKFKKTDPRREAVSCIKGSYIQDYRDISYEGKEWNVSLDFECIKSTISESEYPTIDFYTSEYMHSPECISSPEFKSIVLDSGAKIYNGFRCVSRLVGSALETNDGKLRTYELVTEPRDGVYSKVVLRYVGSDDLFTVGKMYSFVA